MVPSGTMPRSAAASKRRPAWYPSPGDELVLRVALQRDLDAWEALRPHLRIDTMDGEQVKLLPLVHRSLVDLGIEDTELPRLKGLHRHHWFKNQRLLQRVAPVLEGLAGAGIPTMALKGVPLGLTYYDDIGLRPMADFDLLVPFERFREALAIVDALGFRGAPITEPSLRYWHARPSRNSDNTELDLHWLVHQNLGLRRVPAAWSSDFWSADIDLDESWSRGVPLEVAGAPTLAPSPADLLLHVLVPPARGMGVRPPRGDDRAGRGLYGRLRRVADAVTIIERCGSLDWDSLLDQAGRRRVGLAVRDTLTYLDDAGFAAIPPSVIATVRSVKAGRRERLVYRLMIDPTIRPGRLQSLRWMAGLFVRATAQESLPAALAALPGFLAWDAERPRDIPVRVASRLGGGILGAATGHRSAATEPRP